MTEEIVYDLKLRRFRDLDTTNFNEDLTIGIIYLEKKSLHVLKKYFLICGYVLIDYQTKRMHPIDTQQETVAVFESTYNSLSTALRGELSKYIVLSCPIIPLTQFFIEWQFNFNLECFSENGPLIKLSSYSLENSKVLNKMLDIKFNLMESYDFCSLCEFVQKANMVYGFDISSGDYNDTSKYLIDSLINGYRINMTKYEIEKCFYQICNLIIMQLER